MWSPIWIVCGVLVASGTFSIAVQSLPSFENPTVIAAAVALLVGVITGAVIAKHAPVRPWREPPIAAVAGVVLVLLLAQRASGGSASFHVWRWTTLIVAASAGAIVAATVVRRWARAESSVASVLVTSATVHLGAMSFVVLALSNTYDNYYVLLMLGVTIGAAFLTQIAMRRASANLCACGPFIYPLFALANDGDLAALPYIFVGCIVLFLIARIGSGLARRFVVGREVPANLPSAQLR